MDRDGWDELIEFGNDKLCSLDGNLSTYSANNDTNCISDSTSTINTGECVFET